MEVQSLRPLRNIADWIETVGKKNYKLGYSAFECCQSWKSISNQLPEPLSRILSKSGIEVFRDIKPLWVIAEHPVFLDSLKTPSRNDIMAFCENAADEKIAIAVEAKCREPFAERVNKWITLPDAPILPRQGKLFPDTMQPVPRKVRRLQFLNMVLGIEIQPDSHLRYQLLHRTASAIIEGRNLSARAAVMVVQAFTASVENFFDFSDFCDTLGLSRPRKDTVLGPYFTPFNESTPLYLLYVQDSLSSEKSLASLF